MPDFSTSKITKEINEIIIEVTMKCNKSCEFCFNKLSDQNNSNDLSTNQIKSLINKIHEAGVKTVRFTGGEPLLRKDLFELMQYAHSKGLNVWMNTNGTLITNENAKKINEYVSNILISFHSLEDKDIIKNSIEMIRDVKTIRCGTIATQMNIMKLEKFMEAVNEFNIDRWEIFRPMNKNNELNHKDIKILVEKIILFNKSTKTECLITNSVPFCAYDPEKISSISSGAVADDGYIRFVVGGDGFARPTYFTDKKIGNLIETSVENCWNDDFMKKMRKFDFIPEQCKKCNYVEKCRGGSRFIAKHANGSYNSLDPLSNMEYVRKLDKS
jgi:radical SAM protein with 4Fe4S-binding SPASM domain